jgi:hypothetical protein
VRPASLVVVVVLATFLGACQDEAGNGPLAQEPGNSSYATSPAKAGQIVSFGLWLPANPGHEAILRSIEPADPAEADGLELRYAGVRPNSGCSVGALNGWPPPSCEGDLVALEGFRVPEGVPGGILVGAEASSPGRWLVHAFRVRYEVDGQMFENVYLQGIGLKVAG